jgi:glycosyltransferase involved in cell wall biosynthesis
LRIAFMSWRDLANDLAGGAEIFVDRLAVQLLSMGHDVMHLCGGPVGPRPYRVVETGGTYSQYVRAPIVHHRVAKDWDLLVDTENGIPFFSPLWRRGPILACVYHVHSEQWDQRFSPAVAAMGRFAESRVMPLVYRRTPFMAISSSTASALEGIGINKSRIHVLQSGVDPPSPDLCERSAEPLFVCLGRLVPHKRVDLLLRAWNKVRPVTKGKLLVVGDGPDRNTLEALAGEGVEFTGRVGEDEKWKILSRAWALIHPAHHEGWGIVIIEAAEVGTPTVGFNVPGVRDAIVDDVSGLLVESEEALVREWIEIAQNRPLLDRLSDGARRHGSHFGWDQVARDFSDIAQGIVGSAVKFRQ